MGNEGPCPLCGRQAIFRDHPTTELVRCWIHNSCQFYIGEVEQKTILENNAERSQWFPERIMALMHERSLRLEPAPAPLLRFNSNAPDDVPDTVSVWVKDLLATWPATATEKLNRTFLHLARMTRGHLSRPVGVNKHFPERQFFLCEQGEESFILDTLCEYRWLKKVPPLGPHEPSEYYAVTPAGWTKFEELTKNDSNTRNPAFVAMWFGGEDITMQHRQKERFEVIKQICRSLGWDADRSDGPEYNDSIIDKIVFMIRQSPFVIADLSDENQGAYYEAGFARGLGRGVIYLVHEDTKKVHFDISGVNQVRWRDIGELRKSLTNRVLGTMSRGPHKFDMQQ